MKRRLFNLLTVLSLLLFATSGAAWAFSHHSRGRTSFTGAGRLWQIEATGGWLAAWALLGHRPDPVLDPPALWGPAVNAAIMPAQVLLAVAWLVFIVHVASVGAVFYKSLAPGSPRGRKFAILAATVFPWAVAFVLLNADPGQVLKWAELTPP